MRWSPIGEFPGYSVSDEGTVRNDDTGRLMSLAINSHDVVYVGLMGRDRQYKRGVALLVAQAFLEPPTLSSFDTVINLDGDRCNNAYWNLMWRPRWFAVRYHQQFGSPPSVPQTIQEIRTGHHYKNSMEAAVEFGLIDREIRMSMIQRTYVWPTFQEFRVVDE